MHLCIYQKPRSFSDLGKRSLGLNVLTFSINFPSETAGLISVKFHLQHPGNGRLKFVQMVCLMSKMATMPICGKKL